MCSAHVFHDVLWWLGGNIDSRQHGPLLLYEAGIYQSWGVFNSPREAQNFTNTCKNITHFRGMYKFLLLDPVPEVELLYRLPVVPAILANVRPLFLEPLVDMQPAFEHILVEFFG